MTDAAEQTYKMAAIQGLRRFLRYSYEDIMCTKKRADVEKNRIIEYTFAKHSRY